MWSLESDVVTLAEGTHVLRWGVPGEPNPNVRALVLVNLAFIEVTEEDLRKAAEDAEADGEAPGAEEPVERAPGTIKWTPPGS